MPIPPRSTGARVLLPLLALTLTACAAPSTPPLSPRLPPPDPRLMAPPPEPESFSRRVEQSLREWATRLEGSPAR